MATELDDETTKLILARATESSGIDFAGYRRSVMTRRVRHRSFVTGCHSLPDYLRLLDQDAREVRRLVSALLIKTTELFRELPTLELLSAMLPRLVEQRIESGEVSLRVWVAGCSSGEEAFSLACVLLACTESLEHPVGVRVLGSDVDEASIAQAKRGIVVSRLVPPNIPPWAQRWFSPFAEGFAVSPTIRAITSFSRHDLLDQTCAAPREAVVASFDVVSCRNVLIYLDEPHRGALLARLIAAVEPGGFLMLGDAESTPPETSGLVRIAAGVPLYARIA